MWLNKKNLKKHFNVYSIVLIIFSVIIGLMIDKCLQIYKENTLEPEISVKLSERIKNELRIDFNSLNLDGNKIEELSIKLNIPGELNYSSYLNSAAEEHCKLYYIYKYSGRISARTNYNNGTYGSLSNLITDIEIRCSNINPGENHALNIGYNPPEPDYIESKNHPSLGNYTLTVYPIINLKDFGTYNFFWYFNEETKYFNNCIDLHNLTFIQEDNYNVVNYVHTYCYENGFCENVSFPSITNHPVFPHSRTLESLREYEINKSNCK